MGLTNAMRDLIATGIATGTISPAFNSANAYIGVGNGAGAFAAAQTDLLGASKFRKGMDGTYPQQAANVLTYRASYALGEANFDWNEWGVFNHASAGTMFNRKPETLGTKAATQSWQFTVTLTLTAA